MALFPCWASRLQLPRFLLRAPQTLFLLPLLLHPQHSPQRPLSSGNPRKGTRADTKCSASQFRMALGLNRSLSPGKSTSAEGRHPTSFNHNIFGAFLSIKKGNPHKVEWKPLLINFNTWKIQLEGNTLDRSDWKQESDRVISLNFWRKRNSLLGNF